MKNKKRLLFVVVACCAILAIATALAATTILPSLSPSQRNPSNSNNPDDIQNHIKVKEENGSLVLYNTVTGTPANVELGLRVEYGDYLYVYGYHFAPAIGNDRYINWVAQSEDIGWGCAVKNDALQQITFESPAGLINGKPVTWMTYAYSGCENFGYGTALYGEGSPYAAPMIPATVQHTDYMFKDCRSLQAISITTASTLSANTFSGTGCLEYVFIGQSVQTIESNAFGSLVNPGSGASQDYTIYLDGRVPVNASAGNTPWHGNHSYYENADILIWAESVRNDVKYIPNHG